jgi:hypothetical protein
MSSSSNARFPVVESWIDAASLTSSTLQRRRDGVRLMARLSITFGGLTVAAETARRHLDNHGLATLVGLLVALTVGFTIALGIVLASTIGWRLRLRRLLRMAHAARQPSAGAGRAAEEPRDRGDRILAS